MLAGYIKSNPAHHAQGKYQKILINWKQLSNPAENFTYILIPSVCK